MAEILEGVLLVAALIVVAFCAAGVVLSRTPLARLHYLAAATSLAVPLVGLAALVVFGLSLGGAAVAVTVLLVAFSGPAVSIAIGRAIAQEDGLEAGEPPE